MNSMADEILVYTDGGCSGNPGPGGWGAVVINGESETRLSGGEHETTNNRMELTAAIEALKFVQQNFGSERETSVYSDSQYVKNGITVWIKSWKAKGWKNAAKQPVKNQDLWTKLDALASSLQNLNWNWVKGHAGIKYNEMCDSLCGEEIEKHR